MKCHEIQELFSPYLDNRIIPEEAAQFKQHLLECPACQMELQEWHRVSDILKSFGASTESIKAPNGFEKRVMQQVAKIEEQPRWFKLNRVVKQFTAVAAAAAILVYGAVDLYPRVFNNPPSVNVAEFQNPDSLNLNNNLPGQNNGTTDQPLINGADPAAAGSSETGSQAGDANPNGNPGATVDPLNQPQPLVQNNPDSVGAANVGPSNVSPANVSTMVFLNKPRTISSNLLRLQVSDLALAQKQAEGSAQAMAAKYQVFSVQSSGENQRVILRITVESTKADSLIHSLTKLGAVIESQQNSQDITQKFADTLEQYRTLVAQLNESTDEKQKASLTSQLKTLEQQLTTWDEEAEKQIIMLTIES